MLIILAAIVTVVVFYHTGKNNNQNGIKWAIIGFVGYVLGYMVSWIIIGETFISIFIGCATVYFARVQLLKMLTKNKTLN